jgi:vacuolar-type H+-ATPase subunit C/Vma6
VCEEVLQCRLSAEDYELSYKIMFKRSSSGLLVVGFSYSYMIDNIVLLITGTLHQRAISELIPKCHPLGSFEQMEAIHIASTPADLYSAILVDTPLGKTTVDVCYVRHLM